MASQFAILHSKSPQVQLPCLSSSRISVRFSRSIAMVPQPPVQPLSSSVAEIAGWRFWNFPRTSTGDVQFRRNVAVKSHLKLNPPLVSRHDHLGNLVVLFSVGALGIWSEETKIGSVLSGALVSTLVGLAFSNFGIIASDASTFPIVMEFLLPLAVTLLLFRADLRCVIKSTGTLLMPFLLGSVGTIIGTLVAYFLVPMPFDGESWKIPFLLPFKNMKLHDRLMGMHSIGGAAINYVDIYDVFDLSSLVFAAGLVANNVIRAVYFSILCALASKVPPETTTVNKGKDTKTEYNNKLPVLLPATSLAVSFFICKVCYYLTKYFGIQGGSLPAITVLTVVLATIFSKPFACLAPSGEAMAMILMQVFFAVVGARANIRTVVNTSPRMFMFAIIQILVHLAITIGIGKLLRFDLKSLLIASNANIGDPSIVCVIPAAKGWSSMVIPGILAGILGIPIATYLGTGLGLIFFKYI